MKIKSNDNSRANINKLIDLYSKYRQSQYELFEQYNLCLEDPKFDNFYMSVEPLVKYRAYIEDDLNGTEEHSSTTQIIKEFKKFLDNYDSSLKILHEKTSDIQ